MKIVMAVLCAVVASLTCASSARADADWTGMYVGVNAGGGTANFGPHMDPVGANSAADFGSQQLGNQANGAIVGGQIGYDQQFGSFVVGGELDFDGGGINANQTNVVVSQAQPADATAAFNVHESIDWIASMRAKAGYAWGPQWAYVTAGGAWINGRINALASSNTGIGTFGDSAEGNFNLANSHPGWVLGFGYERAVATNWSVRAEYLRYNFLSGDTNVMTFPSSPAGSQVAVTLPTYNVNVIRVGASYRFDGAPFVPVH
jgi:outer membrane immunogenic protein